MKVLFWGATQDVTGSMTFVHLKEGIILIDCGLHQGSRELEKLNKLTLPYPASDIKAVVLTHAHLDHSGFLPALVKDGFRGPIYCSPATAKLTKIILEDSASLDDQTLYDKKDVLHTLQLLKATEWNKNLELLDATFKLLPAGHILGASSVLINQEGKSIVFSGDLGRNDDPLIHAPPLCPDADVIVMESTYGGRIRENNPEKELFSFLMKISREHRVGIMASFAVARAQLLITLIHDFFARHPEEKFRVVLDSPMMVEANQVYKKFSHQTKMPETLKESISEFEVIAFERQWKSLSRKKGPLLIISSSGMLTGGRIQRHLKNWQDDKKAMLFLPGYQAAGTPGRKFLEGIRQIEGQNDEIIHWQGEVIGTDAFSSHADQNELSSWLSEVSNEKEIYLIHGGLESKIALKKSLEEKGHLKVFIPEKSQLIEL